MLCTNHSMILFTKYITDDLSVLYYGMNSCKFSNRIQNKMNTAIFFKFTSIPRPLRPRAR